MNRNNIKSNLTIRIGATVYAVPADPHSHTVLYLSENKGPTASDDASRIAVPKIVKNKVILEPGMVYYEYYEEWFIPFKNKYYYIVLPERVDGFISYLVKLEDVYEAI